MYECLLDPKKRITVKDALASKYFKNIRNVDKEVTRLDRRLDE